MYVNTYKNEPNSHLCQIQTKTVETNPSRIGGKSRRGPDGHPKNRTGKRQLEFGKSESRAKNVWTGTLSDK